MKQILLPAVLLAGLLTACGEEPKQAVETESTTVTDSTRLNTTTPVYPAPTAADTSKGPTDTTSTIGPQSPATPTRPANNGNQ